MVTDCRACAECVLYEFSASPVKVQASFSARLTKLRTPECWTGFIKTASACKSVLTEVCLHWYFLSPIIDLVSVLSRLEHQTTSLSHCVFLLRQVNGWVNECEWVVSESVSQLGSQSVKQPQEPPNGQLNLQFYERDDVMKFVNDTNS